MVSLSSTQKVHTYTCKSDCWSMDVVLYMHEKIMTGKYEPLIGKRRRMEGQCDEAGGTIGRR